MQLALDEARRFEGATRPNPPVGAVILDENHRVLITAAHERAGLSHAERNALERLKESGQIERAHTLIVTLEPCAHYGRTPPCTDAVFESPIRRVVYGTRDLNPRVSGGGARMLHEKPSHSGKIEVIEGVLEKECRQLAAPFFKLSIENRPWLTIKTAHFEDGSMIAKERGGVLVSGLSTRSGSNSNTFTRPSSLLFAHELRRRSDAILTGSGTLLIDQPRLSVRLIPDHDPPIARTLAVLDRRGRVPEDQLNALRLNRLIPVRFQSIEEALSGLARVGCLRVLVEAGPTLSNAILSTDLWDEHYRIIHRPSWDEIERRLRIAS